MTQRHRGQATLEMLLVLLVLVPLLFGGYELARAISIRQALDAGTDLAAQAMGTFPTRPDYAEQLIRDQLNASALCPSCGNSAALRWCVSVNQGPCVTAPTAADLAPMFETCNLYEPDDWYGCPFYIKAQLPFRMSVPFVPLAPITLSTGYHGVVGVHTP
mgnify:CR=1 FL=1